MKVQKVHIGRDGLDEPQGKGLFIEDVEVEIENGETLFFPCDSWVDDQIVDNGTELAFLPGPRPQSSMGKCLHFQTTPHPPQFLPPSTPYTHKK